jgi:hypothetical protein
VIKDNQVTFEIREQEATKSITFTARMIEEGIVNIKISQGARFEVPLSYESKNLDISKCIKYSVKGERFFFKIHEEGNEEAVYYTTENQ